MKTIKFKYEWKEYIAIMLYKLGVKPNVTLFIDEDTLSYGYGKTDGGLGLWEYQIPFNIKSKSISKK